MAAIGTILIANRGEIAVRIARTCADLGITSVAVFSDADEGAAFVRACDEAVRIGGSASVDSYLRIDKIIEAATRTGCDAIHPGFGFLAENPELPEACSAAGLIFIGPSADVIRRLGSKRQAKVIAADAGVPVITGDAGNNQDTAALADAARSIGFPVLIKASAGGGGKGMRRVADEAGLTEAIDSAKREAQAAFGDDTVLVERYIDNPRHVEIQILGDQHGTVLHLGERECSIQRRHQKIIEEAPSPAVDDELRQRMGDAAVALCRAVGYVGAGTVEFIVAPDGTFHFLEVNTRLQVEHPTTELVTGFDIVEQQIRIAEGASISELEPTIHGAAIEVRIYAEDPDNDFLPATGHIVDWHLPPCCGVRVDTGIESGSDVSIHYDPMIAKIIAHGSDREQARRRLIRALTRLSVQGVVTNRDYLLRILDHPEFAAGHLDTHFLQRHRESLGPRPVSAEATQCAAIAATLYGHEQRRLSRTTLAALEPGYRNSRWRGERDHYRLGDDDIVVNYENRGEARFSVTVGEDSKSVRIASVSGPDLSIEIDGHLRTYRIVRQASTHFVHDGQRSVRLVEVPRFPEAEAETVAGGCLAPMPSKVTQVLVEVGQAVAAGDAIAILEAMKMEHTVRAPTAGEIESILISAGDQVDDQQVLAVVRPADD